MRLVPETQSNRDWPRKVSQSVRDVVNEVKGILTRVTTAEADITALETETDWSALADYADDTAAAAGGIAVGKLYRTGSTVKVRVS